MPSGEAPFTLLPLPYAEDALEPAISARTLSFHYGRHHRGYVDKLNALVRDTPFADMPLADLVRRTAGDEARRAIFDNAAQVWNHDFYWRSLSPSPTTPSPELSAAIVRDFGSIEALKAELVARALGRFGSGYAWLVVEDGALRVKDTANAETPIASGVRCLLAIDVWEHAYYLDYQNARKAHLQAVIAGLVNWRFASDLYADA